MTSFSPTKKNKSKSFSSRKKVRNKKAHTEFNLVVNNNNLETGQRQEELINSSRFNRIPEIKNTRNEDSSEFLFESIVYDNLSGSRNLVDNNHKDRYENDEIVDPSSYIISPLNRSTSKDIIQVLNEFQGKNDETENVNEEQDIGINETNTCRLSSTRGVEKRGY